MLNNKEVDTDTLGEYQAKEHGSCLRMLEIKAETYRGKKTNNRKIQK